MIMSAVARILFENEIALIYFFVCLFIFNLFFKDFY